MRIHSPRWRKVFRDLWLNKARTFMVILAMAVGVFGVSSVATAYGVLLREMDRNYMETNPAAAVLLTDPLSAETLTAIRRSEGAEDVAIRRVVTARMQTPTGEWRTLLLYEFDYDAMKVDTIFPVSGAWPPAPGQILLEQAAVQVAGQATGDKALVRVPGGQEQSLQVAGIVHAPGLPPAWMEGLIYGYVAPETLAALGEAGGAIQVRMTVAGDRYDTALIRQVASRVEQRLQDQGVRVYHVEIPVPGKHPHGDQMQTLLFLFESFGALALILSGVLVATMINALMAQQVRQIGVMKAIGATTRQVMGLYLGSVLMLAVAALLVGIPGGMLVGRAYSLLAAGMLNFTIASFAVPLRIYGIVVAAGLLVPLAVAAWPIVRGSRVTVRQAITDYGVDATRFGRDFVGGLIMRIRFLSRPLLLSLRNAIRRPGRFSLTVGTLAVGGAVFMVALNVAAGWKGTVASAYDVRRFDLELQLNRPAPAEQIERIVRAVPGVTGVEAWGSGYASFVGAEGVAGNRFSLYAPPNPTTMVAFDMLDGRWMEPGETDALVLNQSLAGREGSFKAGDQVILQINGNRSTWRIAGIAREVGAEPAAYMPYARFAELTGQTGMAIDLRIAGAGGDTAAGVRVEQALSAAGYEVAVTQRLAERRKIMEDHLAPILAMLLAMALLVVVVGGLGLATTMSMNTLERTREIGSMMAIGATERTVVRTVVSEGVIIGLLSWAGALILSFPLTLVVGNVMGTIFIHTPIDPEFSLSGMAAWLLGGAVLAAIASLSPARRAARLTVRETLAYE